MKGPRCTHAMIVERAYGIARVLGLEGLSLGRLAAEIGMSKSGLFAHFKSKDVLQLEILEFALDRFARCVIRPAIAAGVGARRLDALFEGYLAWVKGPLSEGGCFFTALGHELGARPGPIRDRLVEAHRYWRRSITRAAALAIGAEAQNGARDPAQLAYELVGITLAFQQASQLLGDADAEGRARASYAALLARYGISTGSGTR